MNLIRFFLIFNSICWILSDCWTEAANVSSDNHVRLLQYLLERPEYERLAKPVKNGRGIVNVRTRLTLYQLVDVEEPLESVTLYMWMVQKWENELFSWNPAEFGNISWIDIPYSMNFIWLPDIVLYNGLLINAENSERQINIELMMNPKDKTKATVRFAFPAIYQFRCKVDMTYFPFDTQNCTMIFGSWIHNANHMEMYHYSPVVNLESYIPNGEWILMNFTYERRLVEMKEGEPQYRVMYFHLIIKRRPLFIMIHLVIPVIFITIVSVVGFFTHTSTDKEISEKASLGITALLAMSVNLMIVSEKMPTTSFIPILAWYMMVVILLMCIATISGTAVIIVHRWDYLKQPMSEKQLNILKLLAKFLCVSGPIEENFQNEFNSFLPSASNQPIVMENLPNKSSSMASLEDFNNTEIVVVRNGSSSSSRTDCNSLCYHWSFGAVVLERLFLVSYLIVIAMLNVIIFVGCYCATM